MDIKLAIAEDKPVTGLEVRTVGRQRRFVITRFDLIGANLEGVKSHWEITHAATGRSIGVLLPSRMARTLVNLSAIVRAWDATEGLDWSVIDGLGFGESPAIKGKARERARAFAMRLRGIALDAWIGRDPAAWRSY